MSNQQSYQKRLPGICLFILVLGAVFSLHFTRPGLTKIKTGFVRIIFKNTVKGAPLVLNDSAYTNVFDEPYRVTKFKYYISNIGLLNPVGRQKEISGYHLIDAAVPASQGFSFKIKAGEYHSIFFLAGVDSARNCSGAQTGALDPMNDMFWTWNSGYVMAKLEGRSAVSSSINNRMEYHIGGYKGVNRVLQEVMISAATPILIREGKTTEVIIETDLSKWWQVGNPVTIKETPICATPGELAGKIAVNYRNMFTLQSIKNN